MHLPDYVYHASFRRYSPLKLPLSCEVVEKSGFGAPDIWGDTPGFRTSIFQSALTSEYVAGFRLNFVQRARRVADEKKKKNIEELGLDR